MLIIMVLEKSYKKKGPQTRSQTTRTSSAVPNAFARDLQGGGEGTAPTPSEPPTPLSDGQSEGAGVGAAKATAWTVSVANTGAVPKTRPTSAASVIDHLRDAEADLEVEDGASTIRTVVPKPRPTSLTMIQAAVPAARTSDLTTHRTSTPSVPCQREEEQQTIKDNNSTATQTERVRDHRSRNPHRRFQQGFRPIQPQTAHTQSRPNFQANPPTDLNGTSARFTNPRLNDPRVFGGRDRSAATSALSPYNSNSTRSSVVNSRKSVIGSWNLSYAGSRDSISSSEFIFRVESMARFQGVSDAELTANVVLLLRDEALDWFWIEFLRRYGHSSFTWTDFAAELHRRFQSLTTDIDLLMEMSKIRQGRDSYDDYAKKVVMLRNQMVAPINERDLIEVIKSGLQSRIGSMVQCQQVNSVAELHMLCRKAEKYVKSQLSSQSASRHYIHEVGSEHARSIQFSSDSEAIDFPAREMICYKEGPPSSSATDQIIDVQGDATAISVDEVGQNLTCWNCKKTGHGFQDCPEEQRRLFCFRCGRPEVVTPKCPTCSGNAKPSGARTGTSRSA